MSIRIVASALYRVMNEVKRLEEGLEKSDPSRREELEKRLREARAEQARLRNMLEGSKES